MKKELRRLVIDVNIWIKWVANKRVGVWLESFGEFGIELFGNEVLLEELKDVMDRPFFKKLCTSEVDTKIITREIGEVLNKVKYEQLYFNCPDIDDEYLIEIALKANAVLVTNDKILLNWDKTPVEIISLEELRTQMNELLSNI